MRLITAGERRKLIDDATREAAHLEMRDNYGGDRHLFERWQSGDHDLAFMDKWCERVRAGIARGKRYRRACVVSEPLSEYQRWAHAVSGPQVEAGEDLRWVPRRLVSAVALPGNDFWLLDGEIAAFGIFSGADERVEIQLYNEPEVVKFCQTAFESVWALSIPHREYHPA